MRVILSVLKIIDLINEWAGKIICFFAILLMLVVFEGVISRYFFRQPHSWTLLSSEFTLLYMVSLGGGYTLLHGGHVKVDIIYQLFPVRGKAILDLITYPIILILCIVLVWYGGEEFWRYYTTNAKSFTGWPIILWPFKIMVPVAGALLGVQVLAKWIRDLITAVTGVKMESEVVSGEGGLRG